MWACKRRRPACGEFAVHDARSDDCRLSPMTWLTPQLATLVAALVALAGVGVTILQRWRSDQRDAWWKRAQWAIDKSLSADPVEREIGSRAIGILVTKRSGATVADVEVLRVAAERAFMDFRRGSAGHDAGRGPADESEGNPGRAEGPV